MAMPKKHEKARKARKEIQEKAKMTREELGGALIRGIREEQLDAGPKDKLSPRNRISKLSKVGMEKLKDTQTQQVKEEDVVGQLPPRWRNLLGHGFTTFDFKALDMPVEEVANLGEFKPETLYKMHEHRIHREFYARTYEDDETMKLVVEAYKLGAKEAIEFQNSDALGPIQKLKAMVESHRAMIDFLITDNEEKANLVLTLTPRELVDRITLYFIECDLIKRFYTVPGLAFYIGFASRDDFQEYIENNPESIHVYIIKRALTYIEAERVTDMLYGGGLMAGHKLDLATNFNYNDAGKKNESSQSPTNITVNNNTLSMQSAPPKAESIEEWQAWYVQEQAARKKAIEQSSSELTVTDTSP